MLLGVVGEMRRMVHGGTASAPPHTSPQPKAEAKVKKIAPDSAPPKALPLDDDFDF
jgi:hypothetical protein